MPKFAKCPKCGEDISLKEKSCPHCGVKLKKKGSVLSGVIAVFACIMVASACSSEPANNLPDSTTQSPAVIATKPTEETKRATTAPIAETGDNISYEYKAALKKAETYSQLMHMSKIGVFKQLTSEYGENFPEDAAQYAIDNVVADWNANALAKAESYSKTMYMSKAGIYDQLISEHGEEFTEEEAQYAIDNITADWNANALEKAKSYQQMNMSLADIKNQLVSEYGEKFTEEEAEYAISNLS